MDPMQKYSPGQDWEPNAQWLNAVTDLLNRTRDEQTLLSPAAIVAPRNDKIYVVNGAGQALDQFGVVGLGSLAITPTSNIAEWRNRILFNSASPSPSAGFGILQGPIPNDSKSVAEIFIDGVSRCKISITTSTHGYAAPIAADYVKLLAQSAVGPARIIWHSAPSAWSGATAYVIGDMVSVAGTYYTCTANHTNHTPPNASYWSVGAVRWAFVEITNASASSTTDQQTFVDMAVNTSRIYSASVGEYIFCDTGTGNRTDILLPDLTGTTNPIQPRITVAFPYYLDAVVVIRVDGSLKIDTVNDFVALNLHSTYLTTAFTSCVTFYWLDGTGWTTHDLAVDGFIEAVAPSAGNQVAVTLANLHRPIYRGRFTSAWNVLEPRPSCYREAFGDGVATVFTITHDRNVEFPDGFGGTFLAAVVQCYDDTGTLFAPQPTILLVDADTVTLTFGAAPNAGSTVIVLG